MDHIWKIADSIVPVDRPGDFNQAMMDLGATICTPKKPLCLECPIADLCLANKRFDDKLVMDIEEGTGISTETNRVMFPTEISREKGRGRPTLMEILKYNFHRVALILRGLLI